MKVILENFRSAMYESKNTYGADINEILFAYVAAGNTFGGKFINGAEAQTVLEERSDKTSEKEYEDQFQRAIKSLEVTLDWAAANGWEGDIKKVWWTARPNVLSQAARLELGDGTFQDASPGNPTDVLLEFDGEQLLGISLKSMKPLKGNIGFKNPGVGAMSKSLGIDLGASLNNMDKKALDSLGVPPMSQANRKKWLRLPENAEIREETIEVGKKMLTALRDTLMAHLETMSPEDLRDHILSTWLDAGALYPYYIKVTGRGTSKKGYNASVEDPNNNDIFKALTAADAFDFVRGGSGKDWESSIGVVANGATGPVKILKMRFKFESEKLASSLKMSGDAYK